MKITIVIPSFNEAGSLPILFKKISNIESKQSEIRFIVVNNGSTDNSADVIFKLKNEEEFKNIEVVNVLQNRGYGFGIKAGLKNAKTEYLGWTHADLQTDLEDILQALKVLKLENENKDVIIKGSRKNRSRLDEFFTFGMQLFVKIALGTTIKDINAQPKIFSYKFYKEYIAESSPDDFSLDLYLLYMATINHLKIKEFPVYFHKREFGEAKGGGSFKTKFKLIKRTIQYILELKSKIAMVQNK